ncbi:integral membrane sensor signal transduction histidine kinase [Exiguobacterium sibiricum 255-15]|uniref:histidine kinase n=1 Tax=Exiguobacterium sibiricum (strain DSM 17290 / CCUG 55495 / CIP 109462 / JCM 13490 / 255-15) TaxID=262543 RepID=B1YLJ5_EXIS2|nr:HAMP domain-containing sensor histidine kinase [Exiguobacterium sibiricum]ACB61900.1 integral membrane sensor signal transduction histidine kinase [Exiguobacterium sibiricum 255-15]
MSKLMRKFLLAVLAPLLIMGVLSFSLTAFLVNRFAEGERYSQLTREANIIKEALAEDRPVPREIQGFITRDGVTERIGGRGRQVVELPILNDLQQQDSIEVQGNRLLTYQLTSGDTVITTIREAPLASSALDGVYLAIGVALLAALLLATGLAYYMGRQFIRPIMELRMVAKQIGDGRKDVLLPDRPNDEVGDLIHAVDEMQEQLIQKEALQKSFIAGITHDLRTPLAIIRNETEALAAGVIPVDELPDVTSSIIEETDRLGLLIDETLVYSKLAGGMMPLDRTEVALDQLVEETAERLQSTFQKDGLRLTVETVPVRLSLDRRMFERVLVNFLVNAQVAAPVGSEVLVRLTATELTVEDAGNGVAENARSTIWDLYVKQTGGSGHGLGLAISRLILDSHGLAYGVRDSALGGACFYIQFK